MSKKKLITQSFIDLVSEKGSINDITIKEVAVKAGIGKGTVYEYFNSKEEIILSTVELVVEKMMSSLLINEGYEDLNYEESLRKYVNYIQAGVEDVGEVMRIQQHQMPVNFKASEIKDIIIDKFIDFQNKNLILFKERVYQKGIDEGIVEQLDDNYIRIIIRMIIREFQEHCHFNIHDISKEELNVKIFDISTKLLKAGN